MTRSWHIAVSVAGAAGAVLRVEAGVGIEPAYTDLQTDFDRLVPVPRDCDALCAVT